jgi:hypothetical protein
MFNNHPVAIDLPGWLLLDYPTPQSLAGAIRALGEPVHG